MLPKEFQFSRLYILIGTIWVLFYYLISRIYLHFTFAKKFKLNAKTNENFIIIGSIDETERVGNMLRQINGRIESIYYVSATDDKESNQIGILSQLDQLILKYKIDEIIFCA